VPQRQEEPPARAQQRRHARHRPAPLRLVEMHPDRGREHEIEAPPQRVHASEPGQRVVEPGEIARCRMPAHAESAQLRRRLDREDAVAFRRERGAVAAGAGADIEHVGGRRRKEMPDVAVQRRERKALVALDEFFRLGAVAFGAARANAHRGASPSAMRR
jgi:hypothetical protein